jgi:hypothetical protein
MVDLLKSVPQDYWYRNLISAAAHSIQALQSRLGPAASPTHSESPSQLAGDDDDDDLDDDIRLAIRLSLESHASEFSPAADPRRTSAPASLQRDHPSAPPSVQAYAAPRPQSHCPSGAPSACRCWFYSAGRRAHTRACRWAARRWLVKGARSRGRG